MLAHALRAASDEQLAALLLARRDLATPPPADTDVLARRAAGVGSVARACEQLNARELAAVEALLVLDADREPAELPAVDRLLG
ncbi:MAG: helicase-associated domain-containing protein, partial [Thermocrispum sp.]